MAFAIERRPVQGCQTPWISEFCPADGSTGVSRNVKRAHWEANVAGGARPAPYDFKHGRSGNGTIWWGSLKVTEIEKEA